MKVVTERDAVEVEEKLLRFFSTNEEFIQRSETCVEALSHGITCDSCERIIDCHDADDSDAVGMDGTAAGTVAAGRSRKMVLLQFAEDKNHNDMQLCMACYERGAPPQRSGNRPWPAEGPRTGGSRWTLRSSCTRGALKCPTLTTPPTRSLP